MLRRNPKRWRSLHWVLLGLSLSALLTLVALVSLVAGLAKSFDTDKSLSDFASPQQARDFVSQHLPLPLPAQSTVMALEYQRWTDWHLAATVELSSAEAVRDFIARARAARVLNDPYCGGEEPARGARFYLPSVAACGSLEGTGISLRVVCETR